MDFVTGAVNGRPVLPAGVQNQPVQQPSVMDAGDPTAPHHQQVINPPSLCQSHVGPLPFPSRFSSRVVFELAGGRS